VTINHPALAQALARDRALELRRCAEARRPEVPKTRRRPVTAAVRHAAGWLLVDLGLWLVSDPGRSR
jgi:hypothetical protein